MTTKTLAIICDDMAMADVPNWKPGPGATKESAIRDIRESVDEWLVHEGCADIEVVVSDDGDFKDGDDLLTVTLKRGGEECVRGSFKVGNAPDKGGYGGDPA